MGSEKREQLLGADELQQIIVDMPAKFTAKDMAIHIGSTSNITSGSLIRSYRELGLIRKLVGNSFVYMKQEADGSKLLADAMGYKVPAGIGLAARRVIGPTNVKYEAA